MFELSLKSKSKPKAETPGGKEGIPCVRARTRGEIQYNVYGIKQFLVAGTTVFLVKNKKVVMV